MAHFSTNSVSRAPGTILTLLVLLSPCAASAQDASLAEADLVVVGTIVSKGQSANAETIASASSAVVRMEEIVKPATPSALHGFIGKQVTITLSDPDGVDIGERLVFYTRLVSIGSGLSLAAIAQRKNEDSRLAAAMENEMTELADATLKAQLDVARTVVVGKILRIEEPVLDAAATSGTTLLSEHAPQWRNAVIDVGEVLKGDARVGDEVIIRFSASMDVLWFDAPKLAVDQEGVFSIGAARAITGDMSMAIETPDQEGTVIKRTQVLPLTERARVQRLLQ